MHVQKTRGCLIELCSLLPMTPSELIHVRLSFEQMCQLSKENLKLTWTCRVSHVVADLDQQVDEELGGDPPGPQAINEPLGVNQDQLLDCIRILQGKVHGYGAA